jgi:signal transduction histidine kinase
VRAEALLSRADAELARAGGVIRAILDDLQPDPLTADGLVAAVRARAEDFDRPDVFDVSVVAPTPLPVLAPQVEVAVLRVASEAICNSARHSGGSACQTTLTPHGSGVSLVVRDDGTGIPEARRHGVGLESMAARTAAAGGRFEIQAAHPTGTIVSAWFPADAATSTAEPAAVRVSAGSIPGGAS